MNGWVKLHRRLMAWEWYTDGNAVRVFIHLLLSANHKAGTWRGVKIGAGQVVTGRIELAKDLNLSQQQIRTAMDKLKSTNEITVYTTNRYSVVTLVKWEEYQGEVDEVTSQSPAVTHPGNQQITTNKKDNNKKKERSITLTKPSDIPDQLWTDFIAHRKTHKAALTETAMNGLIREAGKANMTLPQVLELMIERNWRGFQSSWDINGGKNGKSSTNGHPVRGHAALAELGREAREAIDLERSQGEIRPSAEDYQPEPVGLFGKY